MIQGKCPKCGEVYIGWALLKARQICPGCKVGILVTNDKGKNIIEGPPSCLKIIQDDLKDKKAG